MCSECFEERIASEALQQHGHVDKIQAVLARVIEYRKSVESLRSSIDCKLAERLQTEQLNVMNKLVRNLEEDLIEELINLDKLSELSQEARGCRKNAINHIDGLIAEVEHMKIQLGEFAQKAASDEASEKKEQSLQKLPCATGPACTLSSASTDQHFPEPWRLKVALASDVRCCRWTPPIHGINFEAIRDMVLKLYGLSDASGDCLRLQYEDEDADLCTLVEPTLADALSLSESSRRLYLVATYVAPSGSD